MIFEEKLEKGKVGESIVAGYLRRRGYTVMPAYSVAATERRGPQLFAPDCEITAPDLLMFAKGQTYFCEVKRKGAFTWHRKTQKWVTGIDVRSYQQYLKVVEYTGLPVLLVFLHECSQPSAEDLKAGSPSECPTGLFVGDIFRLQHCESHRWPLSDSDMVYWNLDALRLKATVDEVLSSQ